MSAGAVHFFKKHSTDYTNGTSKTTTLLIEKNINDNLEVIYRNPSYKENHSTTVF